VVSLKSNVSSDKVVPPDCMPVRSGAQLVLSFDVCRSNRLRRRLPLNHAIFT
jgi:hypothetical protein